MSTPAERPPYAEIMRYLGMAPDPWQLQVLESEQPQLLLNCSRQAGKSTVVAVRALVQSLCTSGTRVLIVSRSFRQSREVFREICRMHERLKKMHIKRRTIDELELDNGSLIRCVPCKEETIRGLANVALLIIDEAARVPDDLYRAVRPMLAVSDGRIICLSTPYGQRGFFWDAWVHGGDDWGRIEVPADQVPRIRPEFLEKELRALGEACYRQEYFCRFEVMQGLVYPDFGRCIVDELPEHVRRDNRHWRIAARKDDGVGECSFPRIGGIDFGFRNPFAAVWGLVDHDGVIWLLGERYASQQPLSEHMRHLPKSVIWYADPAGAGERCELVRANFKIRKGNNSLREGISAVTARINDGGLRVLRSACPNLIREASLYGWAERTGGAAEEPIDANNHGLAALRYMVSRHDRGRPARRYLDAPPQSPAPPTPKRESLFNSPLWNDDNLWTRIR